MLLLPLVVDCWLLLVGFVDVVCVVCCCCLWLLLLFGGVYNRFVFSFCLCVFCCFCLLLLLSAVVVVV